VVDAGHVFPSRRRDAFQVPGHAGQLAHPPYRRFRRCYHAVCSGQLDGDPPEESLCPHLRFGSVTRNDHTGQHEGHRKGRPEECHEERCYSGTDADYEAFKAWKVQREAEREAAKPKDAEWYVHLANGDVVRVKESDVPGAESLAHFIKDGHAHTVIGVYPVESKTSTEDPTVKKDEKE
jgi:hypothetical protein